MFLGRATSVLRKAPKNFFNFFPYFSGKWRKKFESNRSDHTFGIWRALVLHVNGCFISSYCGTAMDGKGLTVERINFKNLRNFHYKSLMFGFSPTKTFKVLYET